MGIDTAALHDNSATDLWAPAQYRLKEFKVLRETGVDRRQLVRSFRALQHSLCVVSA